MQRLEREALIQNENMQAEAHILREEIQRLRLQCDKQTAEIGATQQKLEDANDNIAIAKEEVAAAKMNEQK